MWGQANNYAKFIIVMYFVLPALLIWLAWVAEKGGEKHHEQTKN